MKIEIINVQSTSKPTAKGGTYTQLDVAYKNLDFKGKVEGRKIMSFTHKEVFAVLSKATNGQVYDVTRVKEGEFWQWTEAKLIQGGGGQDTPVAQEAGNKFTGTASPKSNYETAEERALRQKLIVKQSSLSSAISVLKTEKNTPSVKDVLELADTFYEWVLDMQPRVPVEMDAGIGEMQDDIPF